MLKKVFKVGEAEYAVVKPSPKVQQEAQRVYNKTWYQEQQAGSPLRQDVERILRQRKDWDDEKEAESEELKKKILAGEKKIRAGGMKASEGREIALQLRRDRNALRILNIKRNELDNVTAEAMADNARFDYLVSQCAVDNTKGAKVFSSYEDYLEKKEEEIAYKAASNLAMLLYDFDENSEGSLPENRFLKKMKYARESDGHLIDKQGRLIDVRGRLVNEDGNLINEAGELINELGERLDEQGSVIVEEQPWLDEDGNPIDMN